MKCDVGIVGAGPAGATAALLFARLGLHVVLVDRATFPRAKACGDCLSPEVSRLLARIGLLDAVRAAGPARLAGWRIVAPGGRVLQGRFADSTADPLVHTALALSREHLDTVLLRSAILAGTQFVPGVHITAVRAAADHASLHGRTAAGTGFELRARLIVGADGLRSVVARRLALVKRPARLRKISLTAHLTGFDGDDEMGEMHLGDGLCLGIAPVSEPDGDTPREWNLTLVAHAERFGRRIAADPAAFFHESLEHFPRLAGRRHTPLPLRAGREDRRAAWLLRSGPFDVPTRTCVAQGIALIGDAAGYYDPFTGQGIHQAMRDAELLVALTATALRARRGVPMQLDRYAARRRALIRGPRTVQRIIDTVLRRRWSADAAVDWLAERPDVFSALLAVTGDIAPPWTLARPGMLITGRARA